MLAIFLLFSIPIGCFASWFGWKAYQAGRKNIVFAMAWVAFLCFSSALLIGGWAFIATAAS
ncbi:hypothetical protein [Mariprofundus micogutta]|uniref:hypothetical protein n=1 Tax=Mariprofundus micogutta TaxID=1921010 RepID=UPI0009F8DE19|nr:hypothetical protein [Mariprofundus micogutta]